jgi:membrane peptidoglycan carboxypeptidase
MLKELLDYDWSSTLVRKGYITKEDAQKYRTQGIKSNSWCRSTNSPDYEYMEWLDVQDSVDKYFTNVTIERMKELAKDVMFDDVRLVMWFDN